MNNVRWVFLDIGKFGGLAETMDEANRYPITTSHDGSETAPCVLAGPTCDSADVLYEKTPYPLPCPDDRRRGADRGNRRLYDDLRVGGVQRVRAAAILRDLSAHDRVARRRPVRTSNHISCNHAPWRRVPRVLEDMP